MSKNTVKASDVKAVPFFARFLEKQAPQQPDQPDQPNQPNTPPPVPYTFKFPSDLEDR